MVKMLQIILLIENNLLNDNLVSNELPENANQRKSSQVHLILDKRRK